MKPWTLFFSLPLPSLSKATLLSVIIIPASPYKSKGLWLVKGTKADLSCVDFMKGSHYACMCTYAPFVCLERSSNSCGRNSELG